MDGPEVKPTERVRLCQVCGQIAVADEEGRCQNCQSFSGLVVVPRPEAEQLARRQRFRFLRSRLFRLGMPAVPLILLVLWVSWGIFDLAPNPPGASTDLNANASPESWPQERRTPQNTGYSPRSVPQPQQVKWTFATKKPLVAAPAVVDEHVYLTTGDGRTVALAAENGALLWEYSTWQPSSSTPAVAGDLVITAVRPGLVVALDRYTGESRWNRAIGSAVLASPIVAEGTVYLGAADSQLYALDAATGAERWHFATTDWVISSVAYADGMVLVTSENNLLHVIDSKTGRERLRYNTGRNRRIRGSPIIEGDIAYFGAKGGRVWAIDWHQRSYPLESTLFFWQTNFYIWGITTTPPVQKGSVWATYLGGDIIHTPAASSDTIFAVNSQNELFALDAITGMENWRTQIESDVTTPPVVAGETVLVGTVAGIAYSLDSRSGQVLWDFPVTGPIQGHPVVVGSTIYLVSGDGTLYALGPGA